MQEMKDQKPSYGLKRIKMAECETCHMPLVLTDDHYWADFQETFWRCPKCNQTYVTYQNMQFSPIKRMILQVLRIVQHNGEHFVKLHVFGENIYACSRCLGAYTTGLICWFLFGILYFLNVSLPFSFVFITSLLLGSVTLIDYATVDIFHTRKGNNRIRLIAGALLGISGMLYFWLLPTDWWFRMGTLLFYIVLAMLVAYISVRMNHFDGKAQISAGQ